MDPNLRGPTHPSTRSGGLRTLMSSYSFTHLRYARHDFTTFVFPTSNGSQTIGPAFQNMTSGDEKGWTVLPVASWYCSHVYSFFLWRFQT